MLQQGGHSQPSPALAGFLGFQEDWVRPPPVKVEGPDSPVIDSTPLQAVLKISRMTSFGDASRTYKVSSYRVL